MKEYIIAKSSPFIQNDLIPEMQESGMGQSPEKINQGLENSHRITKGKVQYQSPDTSGEATSGWRLVLHLALSDEVGIFQSLIYFFWG